MTNRLIPKKKRRNNLPVIQTGEPKSTKETLIIGIIDGILIPLIQSFILCFVGLIGGYLISRIFLDSANMDLCIYTCGFILGAGWLLISFWNINTLKLKSEIPISPFARNKPAKLFESIEVPAVLKMQQNKHVFINISMANLYILFIPSLPKNNNL